MTGKFVNSLGLLMNAISETEPHYIRCVKPNEEQLPMSFQVLQVFLWLEIEHESLLLYNIGKVQP